jgi:hypothetical protein
MGSSAFGNYCCTIWGRSNAIRFLVFLVVLVGYLFNEMAGRWGASYGDLDNRKVSVRIYEWEGVGTGGSAFGHMSAIVDGISYSFGPDGLDIRSAKDYLARNDFRGARVMDLSLSTYQAHQFAAELSGYSGLYNFLTDNCATLIQGSLSKVGYDIPFRPTPARCVRLELRP